MNTQGVYGRALSDHFHLEDEAPAFVAKTLKRAEIAVTHVQCCRPNQGLIDPILIEDAYLIGFHYEDCLDHELWVDGKAVQKQGANLLLRSSIPMAGRARVRFAEGVLLQIGQDPTSPFYRRRGAWCFFITKIYGGRGQQASNLRGARSTLRLGTDLAPHNALLL